MTEIGERSRGRGRPSRAEEQAIHDAIVVAATAEFRTFGFHDAQMERIAAAAGVGKVAVYRRFASKVDLLLALIEDMGDGLERRVTELASAGDPLEALRIVMRAFRTHMGGEQHVALLRLVATTATADSRIGQALDARRMRLVAPVDALVSTLIAEGRLRSASVVTVRETLFDLLVNGAPSLPLQGMVEDERLDQAFDFRWAVFANGLLVDSTV